MNDRKKIYDGKNYGRKNSVEDTTEYGEFVATFDAWMTPEELKRRAKHLANLDEERK
jgi:hypothetical protein